MEIVSRRTSCSGKDSTLSRYISNIISNVVHTMGAGASSYQSRQNQALHAEERRKKRAIRREQNRVKQAEDEARKAERDAWLQTRPREMEEDRWWGWAWLKWPVRWWKEKKDWEKEKARRARVRNPDHELTALIGVGPITPVQEERAQAIGGPIAESGQMRKRERK